MVGPLGTLPGVTLGSVSGSMFCSPFQGTPGQNSAKKNEFNEMNRFFFFFGWGGAKLSLNFWWAFTWGPVNIRAVGHLFSAALALTPTVLWNQGAGRRL